MFFFFYQLIVAMDGDEKDDCTACHETIGNEQYYMCDSCMRKVHRNCVGLTASEVKCMPLQKRMLLLICDDCRNLLVRLPSILGILDELRRDIKEMKEDNRFTQARGPVKSYADILGSASEDLERKTQDTQTLIVKPKNRQDAKKTQVKIHESIKPSELKVGIKSFRTTKQGSVVLKCSTRQEIDRLKEAAKTSLGDLYEIEIPKKKLPRIKIIGYTGEKSANEVEHTLRGQNNWIGEKDEFKVTYLKKRRNRQETTIFAECSPDLFRKIMTMKRVFIDWERCVVYEDLQITRCYNCQGFYHKGGTCVKKKICGKCAEDHDSSACQNQMKKCHNCLLANSLYGTVYDTGHTVNDPVCPSYRYHINVLKSKIDYGP